MLLAGPLLFRAMGGQGAVLTAALSYSNVTFAGAAFVCMANFLGNAVRGTGNMTFPASVLVGSVAAHVLIAPVLIFGWGPVPAMGPAGAGWGIVAAFAGGSLVLISYLRLPHSIVTLAFGGVRLQRELFAEILKVGIPA